MTRLMSTNPIVLEADVVKAEIMF